MIESLTYYYKKSVPYNDLKLFVMKPENPKHHCTAMVFFHGAGFTGNKVTPSQFKPHALHFLSLGMVCILVEYRPSALEGLFSPIESLMNAKSAIRWIRGHYSELGIDPNRIISVGASAGGYLSLCTAMVEPFNDPMDEITISPRPDALIIFNGGVNAKLLLNLFPELEEPLSIASPVERVRAGLPPSLFFHGTEDQNIPIEDVIDFTSKMRMQGNNSELIPFEGAGHGFFNYDNLDHKPYEKTIVDSEYFLKRIGFLGER